MTLTPAIFYCQSKILVKEMHMPDMVFPRVVFPEKAFSYWHKLFLFIREGFRSDLSWLLFSVLLEAAEQ